MRHTIKQWFIHRATEHPRKTILINISITILFGLGLPNVLMDDDFLNLLPADMPSRQTWDNIRDEFGNTENIFVAIGKKDQSVWSPELLAATWDIAKALEDEPDIDDVLSIATMNRMDSDDGFMEVSDLQPGRELTGDEISGIKQYLESHSEIKVRFVSKYEDYFNIVIRAKSEVSQAKVNKIIEKTVKENIGGFDYMLGGHAYITGTMPELIRNDAMRLMVAGLVVMIIILLWNLRSGVGVMMVLSVILMSLVSMMGTLGWIYRLTGSDKFVFSVLNSPMPIILLTIANSDGVHILTKFFKEFRKSKDKKEAVVATMDNLQLPVFLTSITTVAAFLTLVTAPIVQLTGFGIAISIGVSWAWYLSATSLPSMIYLKKWDAKSKAIASMSPFEKLIDNFGFHILRIPKRILGIGILLVVAGIYGMFLLKVEVNIASFFKPGTQIRDSFDFMDEEMAGTFDILIRMEGDMKDPGLLHDMEQIQEHIEAYDFVTTSISIADIIKQMHRTVMDDDPTYEVIPDSAAKINNLFTLYSMSGDPDDFSSLVDYDYQTGLVTALMRNISASQIIRMVNDITEFTDTHTEHGESVTISGILVIFRDLILRCDKIVSSEYCNVHIAGSLYRELCHEIMEIWAIIYHSIDGCSDS